MDLLQKISKSTTVLTPNRRLAAYLKKAFNQQQLNAHQKVWGTLDSLPLYPSWLERIWKDYTGSKIQSFPELLSPNQETLLWERMIRHDPKQSHLLNLSETAQLAKSAYEILKRWCIKLNDPALTATENSRVFLKWAYQFEQQCKENNWLPQSHLCDHVANLVQQQEVKIVSHLMLVGFTEVIPQFKYLLQQCEAQGITVNYEQLTVHNNESQYIALPSNEEEIITMARWAKAQWENSDKNTKTIGCIIPNLEQQRETVLRIFNSIFDNQNEFNISAGKSLANYPIISSAFKILSLPKKSIPFNTFTQIIKQPFIGDAENEQYQRANLEVSLRRHNIHTVHYDDLKLKTFCPALSSRLKKYVQFRNQKKGQYHLSEWINYFLELLSIMGWPGERSLNSEEYQIVKNGWLPLLHDLKNNDNLLSKISYEEALHYLTLLSKQISFQCETPPAFVQILGLLEATGLHFDCAWLMGLDDTSWPRQSRPNPFIPIGFQKKLNMPNASAERELVFSKMILSQIKNATSTLIVSYASHKEDYELKPSSLIREMKLIDKDDLSLSQFQSIEKKLFDSRDYEFFYDDEAKPISADEKIKGGVAIFREQFACPFKAFAKMRLHAQPLEKTMEGLRPLDRGQIVHQSLELIWRELKDLDTLKNKTKDELKQLISTSIELSIQNVIPNHLAQRKRYLTLEKIRLEKLLENWLEEEKQRPNFKVVSQELEKQVTIDNISISIRIDRIDELNNGEQLIIDYKTGKYNSIAGWFGNRMEEPQLPLYCVIESSKTIGISFAEIHPDKIQLTGISKIPLEIKSIKLLSDYKNADAKLWDAQIKIWQQNFAQAANDFYNGKAQVAPKNVNETCLYCELHSLCRVYEHD